MIPLTKICSTCSIEKSIDLFIKKTKCCKECKSKYRKSRYENNKEYYISYAKKASKTDKRKIKQKEYQIKEKEKIKEYQKIYRIENDIKIKEKRKSYNPIRAKRWKERYENDILYKMKIIQRSIFRRFMRDSKMDKNTTKHSQELLGYTHLQLKEHIENLFELGMNWNNHGEWHIDHIVPITAFELGTPACVVNALSNLQPLWALDNIKKSNKI